MVVRRGSEAEEASQPDQLDRKFVRDANREKGRTVQKGGRSEILEFLWFVTCGETSQRRGGNSMQDPKPAVAAVAQCQVAVS